MVGWFAVRLEKVDLNLFVVFDAIYRERSVTKVAVLLNLTQPAVSNALSRLRDTFDDPLFIRTPNGMAPTPVADSVVADVRSALALLDQSVAVNARFDPMLSEKVFNLGMNDLAESLLLPHLHAAIKTTAPKIALTSYYVAREVATEDLRSGGIDLLIDAPVVNAKELSHKPLGKLPYVVAMGYRRRVAMRVQNYLVAARITAETDLLWTVPKVLAEQLPLHTVELPFAVEPLVWNLYWTKSAENDPASQWMREIISTAALEAIA